MTAAIVTTRVTSLKLVRVYNWIAPLASKAGEKLIPERTGRTTTNPRPCTERSRQGLSKYIVYIFMRSIFVSYFKSCENRVPTKIHTTESDSLSRILVCWGPKSFWSVSVCTGIMFLVFWESQSGVCVLDNQVFARTGDIYRIQNNNFLRNYRK